jgi:hypothetical protein
MNEVHSLLTQCGRSGFVSPRLSRSLLQKASEGGEREREKRWKENGLCA